MSGRYKNLEEIYASPTRRILRGTDCETGRNVVLKTGGQDCMAPEATERLRREFRLMQLVDSPHVVKAVGEIVLDGRYCLVEEHCPGTTLSRLLKQGPLGMREFFLIAQQVVAGLCDLHEAGVVHKDVNPSNIVYDAESGRTVLLDLGISTEFAHEQAEGTRLDGIEGTLRYLSPEQTGRVNAVLDHRADFYSLGVTLFEMLAGRCPFESEVPAEMVFAHIAKAPPSLLSLLPNLPAPLAAIIDKLLSKMAKDRYASCEGLLHDLERCAAGEPFALGERDFGRRFEFAHELYGREGEVAQLAHDYDEAAAGGKVIAAVSGYSGIGKTSLVGKVQAEALSADGLFIGGKFDQYHANVPYFAFFEAIRQFCNQILIRPDDEVEKWRADLSEALGDDAALLSAKVAELASLTGAHALPEGMGALEERTRFKEALAGLLSRLAAPEHPLVLFLDDVHLADMGSMEMLEEIFKNDGIGHLMVVVCYRDNEVSDEHPIIHSLGKIVQRGGRVTRIELKGLDEESLARMLADALRTQPERARGLAGIVSKKTKGNPFYAKQFLRLCHERGYLDLDREAGAWRWDEGAIGDCPASENVVDFLAENLDRFPEQTRSLLSFGACIGAGFSVDDLSAVCGLSDDEIERRLVAASAREAVIPTGKDPETGAPSRYRFAHDRFQQVFYTALPAEDRARVHYLLGKRHEEQAASENDPEERLFDIADHYAKGLGEAADGRERRHVQETLLKAAHRCGLVSAFDTAERYLELPLAQPDLHEEDGRELLVQVLVEHHAVLCNLVKPDECDRAYLTLEAMLDDPVELVDSCCLQITSLSNGSRYEEAFELGLALLERLGVPFPRENFTQVLEQEIDLLYRELESLARGGNPDLHEAGDPAEAAIAKLLCRLCGPTIFFDASLSYWTVIAAVRRLIRNGHTPHGLQMCTNLMMPFGALRGDYRTAYEAFRSAMRVAERNRCREVVYGIYCMFPLHTCHWVEDVANGISYARESIVGNAQMGDFEYACYGYYGLLMAVMETSSHADELWCEVEAAVKYANKTGNRHAMGTFLGFQQLCRSLRGELSLTGSFDGDGFSEREHVAACSTNRQALCYHHVLRAFTAVVYRDYRSAYRLCRDAVPLLSHVSSFYPVALHNFLYSLSLCKVLEGSEDAGLPETREGLLRTLADNQAWLEARSADAFCNFGHLHLLIEAERAALAGRVPEALRLYDRALGAAEGNRRVLHHAIACDMAAQRYEQLGVPSAEGHYLREAYRLFGSWGAEGKCAQMRHDHPELASGEGVETRLVLTEESVRTTASLDLRSVLRASQAISEELELEGILEKLMYSLLECAGAQNIYFLAKTDSGYEIQAESHSGAADSCVISRRPATDADVPLGIVSFVERTAETIILDDGERSRLYGKEAHIRESRCKSVLCMPVQSKGELKGILYLENNLAAGVFDRRREEHLAPIAAQLAISLENAYLYEHLRFLVDERTKALREEIKVRREAEEKLAYLANYDALTGLPNRRLFQQIFSRSLREAEAGKRMLAVLYLDLDGFKEVNDTYGHEKGDAVLEESARRLRRSVRNIDTVSRMGGDEFVLLLPDIEDDEAVEQACERILGEIRRPFPLDENVTVHLTASIGVSLFPRDSQDEDSLLTGADQAMYRIKRGSKDHYSYTRTP